MITDKHRATAAMRFLNHLVKESKTTPMLAFPLGFMVGYLQGALREANVEAEVAITEATEAEAQVCIDKLVEKGLLTYYGPAGWYTTNTLTFKAVGSDADPWSGWVTA